MDDLKVLFPQPIRRTLSGQTIEVMPMRMAGAVTLMALSQPVAGLLMAGQFRDAIAARWPEVRALIAHGAGVTPDALDDAWPDEVIDLLAAVIEANLDFFVRRAVPALQRLAALVLTAPQNPGAPNPDGPTSPSASPAGVTTSTPSGG